MLKLACVYYKIVYCTMKNKYEKVMINFVQHLTFVTRKVLTINACALSLLERDCMHLRTEIREASSLVCCNFSSHLR